ncbi:hypothetical protein BHM03_00001426 [Ensete ventricosum]|nr:hypothetical protein BHM03_00001426 [Ensete ventricosum]
MYRPYQAVRNHTADLDYSIIISKVCNTEWYRPYLAVHTGLPVDWYADCPLPGSIVDWGYFRPVTTQNWLVTVNFDCCRPSPGGISLAAKREKEEEGEEEKEEKGELGDLTLLSLDDLDLSPPSLTRCRR